MKGGSFIPSPRATPSIGAEMDASEEHAATQVHVRCEELNDIPTIRRVNEAAFGGAAEAAIVDALRAAGAVFLSMVAVIGAEEVADERAETVAAASVSTWGGEGGAWGEPAGSSDAADMGGRPASSGGRVVGGEVVGHVLVSVVTVATEEGEISLLGLGPLAVLPEQQGQGVGTMLVEACLERLRGSGYAGVVVLGHPGYYPRFGFIPARHWGLRWELDAPDKAFMALELSPGLLSAIRGVVRFRPEFGLAF